MPWRRSVVHNIQSFAKEVGCAVIVEGIETAATAEAALEMGIELGQGYYFGRPMLAANVTATAVATQPMLAFA